MVSEPLTAADRLEAAAVVARAFRDNPGIVAVAGPSHEDERLRLLTSAIPFFVETTLRYGVGEVIREAGKIVAVSLATQPGGYPLPLLGRWLTTRGALAAGVQRALRFGRIDGEMRRRHPRYRHWYLWFLAVDPPHQGRGLGSMLLRSLSQKAERDGVPCYLETDKVSSVRLYEKHGYKVSSEHVIGGLELRLWFMERPAAPPGEP